MDSPFRAQRQKGPRAYIVFSQGRAIAVTDMAKQADEIIRRIKTRHGEAAKWRRPSRDAAEEYATWHNYEMDLKDAAETAARDARMTARRATYSRT